MDHANALAQNLALALASRLLHCFAYPFLVACVVAPSSIICLTNWVNLVCNGFSPGVTRVNSRCHALCRGGCVYRRLTRVALAIFVVEVLVETLQQVIGHSAVAELSPPVVLHLCCLIRFLF